MLLLRYVWAGAPTACAYTFLQLFLGEYAAADTFAAHQQQQQQQLGTGPWLCSA
jgi:hypothetical protein